MLSTGSSAKIAVLAVGSTGDVLPYLSLAMGLRDKGHAVRFLTHTRFVPMAVGLGVDAAAIEDDPRDSLRTEDGRKWLDSGSDPLAFGRRLRRLLNPLLQSFARHALAECSDADCIIASGLACFAATHVAEKLGRLFLPAYLQPITTASEFRNPFVTNLVTDGALWNWLTHLAYRYGSWALFRPGINRMRTEVLQLPPLPWHSAFPETSGQGPMLYGYSPSVVSKPLRWPEHLYVTGYWFPPSDSAWQPPPGLIDFLDAGPPPVCIGFGSMTDRDPGRMTGIAVGALERAGCRGILLTGWGAMTLPAPRDDIFELDSAPHEWLYPRVSAVVHHGGAGTSAAGLRAGRPTVVVPYFGDQFFWGEVVHKRGAGPLPISRKRLTAESLGAAITEAVGNPRIASKAAAMARQIHTEDGVRSAVLAVERQLELRDRP